MSDKQPYALWLVNHRHNAHLLSWQANACAELSRLHEAHEWQHKMAGDRLRRIEKLEQINAQLLEFVQSLIDDYHSDEGFPEARYVVHAARAAIAAAKEQA